MAIARALQGFRKRRHRILACAATIQARIHRTLVEQEQTGWGLTLPPHDQIFGIWYVYDTDAKPYWVWMSGGKFIDARTFVGDLYRSNGPGYREARFRPERVSRTAIGTAKLVFDADETAATVTYTLSGMSVTKRVTRLPFGSAPASHPDDLSDLWWNPDESGWGLALSHHGNNIFGVWYTYGDDGRPLWITLPGGRFTDANTFTGKLYVATHGSPYTGKFEPEHATGRGRPPRPSVSGNDGRSRAPCAPHPAKRIVRIGFGTPSRRTSGPR